MAFFRSMNTGGESNNVSAKEQAFIDIIMGADGQTYTTINAIKNSDIFTAVHTLASDIASSPIMVKNNGIADEMNILYKLLNERPNEFYSGYFLKFILVANALLNGQSYAEIIRDSDGSPLDLVHLRNSEISYDQPNGTNEIIYTYTPGNGKQRIIKRENMLHIKFFSLNGITGISPLSSLKREIEGQEAGKRLYVDFFKRGANLSGILNINKANLDEAARKNMKKNFESTYSGDQNQQGILVLDDTMDFKQLEVNTKVLEIVNNYNHGTKQIAKAFGLPPHKLGIEQTNTSIEQANLDYLTNTLSNYFTAISAELNYKLLLYPLYNQYTFEFDTRRFRETDAKTKRENTIALLQNGIFSLNDALAQYGVASVPNGDKRFMSLNYVDIEIMDEIQKAKAKSLPIPSASEGGEGSE
ncbi:phage portal protein [Bacillus velezensis]|uniref:phage portal protein n=1 Tax=Bacillus velezensis TaxID=492670 RepID=UPI00384D36F1